MRLVLKWWAVVLACISWAGVAAAQDSPQLRADREVVCAQDDDGELVRMQCDEAQKRCLVAPGHFHHEDGANALVPRMLEACAQAEPGALQRLREAGYTMVPARHEAPPGFARDERGRLYQTHFDLRRRYLLGVSDAMRLGTVDGLLRHSLSFELGGVYERFVEHRTRRHRFRFLEAQLRLDPLAARGLLLSYDRGRTDERPNFWITTFIGTPRRFDINLDLGPGMVLGRLWYEPVRVGPDRHERGMALLDITQGHVNWEFVHSGRLEDYVLIRLGAGVGVRFYEGGSEALFYLYPEAAIESAWLIDSRGLTQLKFEAAGRLGHEPVLEQTWYEGRAALSLERVVLAITDQPLSLFIEPSARYLHIPHDQVDTLDFALVAGARISFFVPPRPPDERAGP